MIQNDNEKFLLKCSECGNPFFTNGEKNFYETNNLTIPTRCKKCRNIRKIQKNKPVLDENKAKLYDEIINHWSIEAKKENEAYFYNVNELNIIMNGTKSFVIGRKGSGKTSIAQHLCALKQNKRMSLILCKLNSGLHKTFDNIISKPIFQSRLKCTIKSALTRIWAF